MISKHDKVDLRKTREGRGQQLSNTREAQTHKKEMKGRHCMEPSR